MWICWEAMLTMAHSLWSLHSRLVKCLSGAISSEYRIRPDWQDMVVLATGFTNRDSVYNFLQWPPAFTGTRPVDHSLLLGKITCVYIWWWFTARGSGRKTGPQQERFVWPPAPSAPEWHTDRGSISIMSSSQSWWAVWSSWGCLPFRLVGGGGRCW